MTTRASIVVIGGGIAGLASAWQLGELGVSDVLVVEAEPLLGSHASGRNAAIFLPLEESLAAVWLAARSRDLLDARLGTSWLSAQGVALVTEHEDALDELRFAARRFGVFHERWSQPTLHSRVPLTVEGEARHALHVPLAGVIDVHKVMMGLRGFALRAGARVITGARVASIDAKRGQVQGVTLEDGRSIAAERVVLAAGAWSSQLGNRAGAAPLELTPLRRHLVQLVGDDLPTWRSPTVWQVDEAVYFRPEAGGVLASPCDETPWEPGIPPTDPGALELLATKLEALAPPLESARVQRSWACLRTMTADREPAIGEDPSLRGLYWLAGLGGRGMSCGVAAAELLARGMLGLPHPLSRPLALQRLL